MSMKTLQIYRPGRFRRFGLAAVMLRLLARVLGHWWVYLLVAFLLFPNGPHVLVRNAHVEQLLYALHRVALRRNVEQRFFAARHDVQQVLASLQKYFQFFFAIDFA